MNQKTCKLPNNEYKWKKELLRAALHRKTENNSINI